MAAARHRIQESRVTLTTTMHSSFPSPGRVFSDIGDVVVAVVVAVAVGANLRVPTETWAMGANTEEVDARKTEDRKQCPPTVPTEPPQRPRSLLLHRPYEDLDSMRFPCPPAFAVPFARPREHNAARLGATGALATLPPHYFST